MIGAGQATTPLEEIVNEKCEAVAVREFLYFLCERWVFSDMSSDDLEVSISTHLSYNPMPTSIRTRDLERKAAELSKLPSSSSISEI
jgi:hypothetical protein